MHKHVHIQCDLFCKATLVKTLLEKPLVDVNYLNMKVLISTSGERPLLLKGHISGAKRMASQERFHCMNVIHYVPIKIKMHLRLKH